MATRPKRRPRAAAWSTPSGPRRSTSTSLWAGTDDGLIHLTRDGGKNWKNVTPPAMKPWSKVSQLDASHFDDRSVYAAVNSFRLDDLKPHIFRTHDSGATWQEIVRGLPDGPINAVREDPVRKGLLFAGSELAVFVSFNDGDDWQPLRLNMPATSIRDLVIHDEDLVVAHARPRLLDSRRYFAVARDAGGHRLGGRAPVRAPSHLAFSARHQYRYAAAAGRARGEESARWGHPVLLSEVACGRRDRARTCSMARPKSWPVSPATTRLQPPNPSLNVPTYWLRPFQQLAKARGCIASYGIFTAIHPPGAGQAAAKNYRSRPYTWIRQPARVRGCLPVRTP